MEPLALINRIEHDLQLLSLAIRQPANTAIAPGDLVQLAPENITRGTVIIMEKPKPPDAAVKFRDAKGRLKAPPTSKRRQPAPKAKPAPARDKGHPERGIDGDLNTREDGGM